MAASVKRPSDAAAALPRRVILTIWRRRRQRTTACTTPAFADFGRQRTYVAVEDRQLLSTQIRSVLKLDPVWCAYT